MNHVLTLIAVISIGVGLSFIIDRFITPYVAKRTLARILANRDKIDVRALERKEHGVITTDQFAITVASNTTAPVSLRWTDVEELYAYKRDLFSTDLICIGFRANNDSVVEVHEEMHGYHDLLAALPVLLPEYSDAWFTDVAFPAFAENHRTIWKRA